MNVSQLFYHVMQWSRWHGIRNRQGNKSGSPQITRTKYRWFSVLGLLVVSGGLLASCSGLFGSGQSPSSNASPAGVALAKLQWCGKALMLFRDEGASPTVTPSNTPTASSTATSSSGVKEVSTATPHPSAAPTPKTITNWTQVKSNLGFTVFLPTALPAGSCLLSVSGTLHDAIFGSNFTIGYLLPDRSALTLSEAPMRTQNMDFQCNPNSSTIDPKTGNSVPGTATTVTPRAAKAAVVQLCSGTREKTNIVFSSRGATQSLRQFFLSLRSNIDWVPAS